MTEAFHIERPPLDDGTSAETVERIAADIDAHVIARGFGHVGVKFSTDMHSYGPWTVTAWPKNGADIVQGYGRTPDQAARDLRDKLSGIPTEADIAATLGIEERVDG